MPHPQINRVPETLPDVRIIFNTQPTRVCEIDRIAVSIAVAIDARQEFANSTLRLIDPKIGEEVGAIEADGTSISEAALSTDGHLLITASYYAGPVRLWQLDGASATQVASLPGGDFLLSPDGSTLLVEIDRDFLAIYGIATEARPARPFTLPGRIVPSAVNVRAQPDGEAEIVGSASENVRVLGRSPDGAYVYLPDPGGWVRADPTYIQLALDIPVETLGVLDEAQIAAALATPTATLVPQPTVTPLSAAAPASGLEDLRLTVGAPVKQPVAPPDGLSRITPENAEQVTLLAVLPQSRIGSGDFPSVSPAVSGDGTRLITPPTRQVRRARIWDLLTFGVQDGPEIDSEYDSLWIVVAGSPDGSHFAYSADRLYDPVHLWAADSEKQVEIPCISAWPSLRGNSLVFSPDGQTLAYQGGLLDVPSRTIRAELEDSGGLSFSPDSRLLAVTTAERVYIYDVQTGELLARTPRVEDYYSNKLEMVEFSPDGKRLAAVSYSEVNVFDASSGELLFAAPITGEERYGDVSRVTFSPDGQTLAVLMPQGALELHKAQDGDLIGVYDTAGARGAAFSPDGQLLAVGNPLRLVILATGDVITVDGDYGGSYLTFSPDGSTLLVDSADDPYWDLQAVMVFGVPTDTRPAWSPVTAQVIPSAVNVRSQPDGGAPIVGSTSGEVRVAARDEEGQAVFLPDAEGWVWSAPEYLDLGEASLDALPVRHSSR